MSRSEAGNHAHDFRVPFRVPLNPEHIVEICRRRNQQRDLRTLADWVECGLRLALAEPRELDKSASVRLAIPREVELFCMLATVAPSAFGGPWRALYEHLWEQREYWIFPAHCRWHDDEPDAMASEPRLDCAAVASDWVRLLRAFGISTRPQQSDATASVAQAQV